MVERRYKVAIVGCAETTRQESAKVFKDPEFEIWGINQLYTGFPEVVPYATRWFQMHHEDRWLERDPHHVQFLNGLECPVYTRRVYKRIKNSVAYPKEAVVEMFGSYFTSQIAWMIALAVYEQFKEIHVYGVDMGLDDEYRDQRANAEYVIGFAKGRGITVHIPPGSDLLKAYELYAYDPTNCLSEKMLTQMEYYGTKADDLKRLLMKTILEKAQLQGALGSRIDTDEKRALARQRIDDLTRKEMQYRDEMNQYTGMQAAMQYVRMTWA